jgi:hypothetical protein
MHIDFLGQFRVGRYFMFDSMSYSLIATACFVGLDLIAEVAEVTYECHA